MKVNRGRSPLEQLYLINTVAPKRFPPKTSFLLQSPLKFLPSNMIDFITSDKAVDKTSWFNFDALRFATGKSDLDAEYSKRQIDNMVAVMTAYPDVHLKIGGYTDNVGNPESNMKLSQKRADKVMATLIDKGIDASPDGVAKYLSEVADKL